MHIQVSGKQIDIGESLRSAAESQLAAMAERYFRSAIDGHVTLSRTGAGYRADCAVHAGRALKVHAHADGYDIQAALDDALMRLEKRLRRYKRYLTERGHERTTDGLTDGGLAGESLNGAVLNSTPASDYIIAGVGEVEEVTSLNPTVVAEAATSVESLSVGEAVMALELGAHTALMFRNAAHGGLNVVYRRPDGNIGWIDAGPERLARG